MPTNTNCYVHTNIWIGTYINYIYIYLKAETELDRQKEISATGLVELQCLQQLEQGLAQTMSVGGRSLSTWAIARCFPGAQYQEAAWQAGLCPGTPLQDAAASRGISTSAHTPAHTAPLACSSVSRRRKKRNTQWYRQTYVSNMLEYIKGPRKTNLNKMTRGLCILYSSLCLKENDLGVTCCLPNSILSFPPSVFSWVSHNIVKSATLLSQWDPGY